MNDRSIRALSLSEEDEDNAKGWVQDLRMLFAQVDTIKDAADWPQFNIREGGRFIEARVPNERHDGYESVSAPLLKLFVRVLNEEAANIYSKVKMLALDEREVVANKLTKLALKIRSGPQLEGLLKDNLGRVDDWVPIPLAEARQLERDLDQQCVCWTKETGRFGWIARALPEDDTTARTGVCYARARHLQAQRALDAIIKVEEPKEEEIPF